MGRMDSGVPPMSQSLNKPFYSICFVCLGNICRSPALHAVFETLAKKEGVSDRFFVDSFGVTSYYLGKQADRRIRHAAEKREIHIDHIAQLFKPADFQRFDAIFAVTKDVVDILNEIASSPEEKKKIHLATAYASHYRNQEIIDPFYNGEQFFDLVMEIAFDACAGILSHYNDPKV